MTEKKNYFTLFLCYALWGFQPLYWSMTGHINSYVILGCRIVMAAVFSVGILAVTKRLKELAAVFRNKNLMKLLLPAIIFLFLDWAVFIVAVNSGHVLDASLGYYINPLVLFGFGIVLYKEKCSAVQWLSLAVAAVGVIISTVAFGSFPFISLVIAINWAVYAAIKKNVNIDGVLSIAVETIIMTPFAIAFLAIFKHSDVAAFSTTDVLLMLGSGVVTALPMFLYSSCVSKFPLILMCFAQYLSPTFNLVCGLIMGESFSKSQIVSLIFFVTAIVIFTANEIVQIKKNSQRSL